MDYFMIITSSIGIVLMSISGLKILYRHFSRLSSSGTDEVWLSHFNTEQATALLEFRRKYYQQQEVR